MIPQAKLLHGEQYLKICGPIPTSGTVVSKPRLVEVLDKVRPSGTFVLPGLEFMSSLLSFRR